ncbi:hypothetical protein FNV43_RR16302 [Rhamnella rubrinervis]|uniref:Peptidase S8/S53 domain-containing protein n=1 Tax=Rhamnella rubrinervis TaxID=2594499 RepID=A0A8K0MCX8_9ROSA|nr:hypothetical protein FNV43_RR16302 [Rhamnella rubrinervis]
MWGTSMSSPHLGGIAALLKNSHPHWSLVAIKSAIMTTADVVDHGGKPIVDENHSPADFFAIGAGHVNPSKANDPGLVYDVQPDDYSPYLCGLKYTDKQVETRTQRTVVMCSQVKSIPEIQEMRVRPKRLVFTKVNQKATVEFMPQRKAGKDSNKQFSEGHLKWVSGKYSVRKYNLCHICMKFVPVSPY